MSINEQKKTEIFDSSWVEQQKKTFTKWCNNHLKKINVEIKCFEQDFMDGHILIKLLEVLSNERLPRPESRGMRFHKIANLNIALKFIEEKGVNLASIGAEEIVDGNVKMTLGMIWTIILRFSIQNIQIEERSAKEGLLLWCQRKTHGYRGVDVNNFHTSFKDGMAFGALIHRHRPDLIDISKYDRLNPRQNLNDAFSVAEQSLEIPKMLDIEYLLQPGKVDEQSVMAYVSTFYHRFTSDQKVIKAAETIHSALKINQENESMMQEYDNLISGLLEWIKKKMNWLNSRPNEHSLEEAYKLLEIYNNYGITEKPSHYSEWIQLENTYNSLQMRLKLSGRPCFIPKNGQLISDIEREWAKLDIAEKGFEEWIFQLIETLRFLSHLLKKFYRRCDSYEIWMNEKMSELPKLELNSLKLGDIEPMMNMAKTVKDAISRQDQENDPLVDISNMVDFFREQNYYDMSNIREREKELIKRQKSIYELSLKIIKDLENSRILLEKADKLLLDYAIRVTAFKKWLDSVNEDLEDTHIISNEDDAKQLITAHMEFEKTLPAAETRLEEIQALAFEIRHLCEETGLPKLKETVYSVVSIESVGATWNKMNRLRMDRLKELNDEAKNQKNIQEIKENFRKSSIEINTWIRQMIEEIKKVQFIESDDLEAELDFLVKCEKKVAEFEPQLSVLENNYHKVIEKNVFDTRNLGYSVQKLKIDYEKLRSYISDDYREIEKQKLSRLTSMGISKENISEYQSSFAHFDRDNDHKLSPEEFRSCLISIGYDPTTVNDDRAFYALMKKLDKSHTGDISFEVYLKFMAEMNESHETVDNVINCFRVIANGKPYVTEQILRDNLKKEQAEYCIKNMQPYMDSTAEPGALNYNSFSISLFGGFSDM